MTLTIEIGKGRTIGVTPEQLATLKGHEAVTLKVWKRALKEMLSDANAGIGKRETFKSDQEYGEAAYQASMKLFDNLLKGEVRGDSTRQPRESTDPIVAEAQRMARVKINGLAKGWEKDKAEALANIAAWAGKLGLPNTNVDERKAIIAAAIDANAKRADVIEAATKAVEAKAKVVKAQNVDDIL